MAKKDKEENKQDNLPTDYAVFNGVLSDDFSIYMNPPVDENNSLIARKRY